jgi:hypothetical protein
MLQFARDAYAHAAWFLAEADELQKPHCDSPVPAPSGWRGSPGAELRGARVVTRGRWVAPDANVAYWTPEWISTS